jgi:type IV secretory pathway protease TraF
MTEQTSAKARQAIREGQITVLAIALVATLAVPHQCYLPWLIYNASGSALLGFHGGRKSHSVPPRNMVVVRPSATLAKRLANHCLGPAAYFFVST